MVVKTPGGRECQDVHTKLLRIGLLEPESREYWRQSLSDGHNVRTLDEEVKRAFEGRWFGSRSEDRVRYLLQTLRGRFAVFPGCLTALKAWDPLDLDDRRVLCHWHLQLSDPLYRAFTGQHLSSRFQHPSPSLDRNAVIRWVEGFTQGRWAPATVLRMVAGLLGCLNEAGFCQGTAPLRPLRRPKVNDLVLSYGLYLLRDMEFEGQLTENPYFASVGLEGHSLEYQLARTPGIAFHKQLHLRELSWTYPSLAQWRAWEVSR